MKYFLSLYHIVKKKTTSKKKRVERKISQLSTFNSQLKNVSRFPFSVNSLRISQLSTLTSLVYHSTFSV